MSTSSRIPLALLVVAGTLLVPIAAAGQHTTPVIAAPEAKLQPLNGSLPPHCETCGTVIAINRVDAEEVAPMLKAASAAAAKKPRGVLFEVVVRLNAGTQQVVTVDSAPQLTIGQRVRIIDGVVVPDVG